MEDPKSSGKESSANVFVVRQPIFGKARRLEGYELLFRSGRTDAYAGEDSDSATPSVISASLMLFGLEKLIGSNRAYVNFTEALLMSDAALLLPAGQVVVQIPDTVSDAPEILEACRRLKDKGYVLALDNFLFQPVYTPFLEIAQMVKVDFQIATAEERARAVQNLRPRGMKLLACKVETSDDYVSAERLGYGYFQGFYFCRPSVVSGKSLPASGLLCLEAFREVSKPEIDFDRVAAIIMRDVSFSYKLLRFVNSAAMGLRTRIHSIKQALVILGARESARWLSLIALRDFGGDKPDELVTMCIVRGRMGELLAPELGMKARSSDLFLLGVFSAIDALVDRPFDEVVAELPLAADVQAALLGERNPLRSALDLIMAYERCDWNQFAAWAKELSLKEDAVPSYYIQAVAWANEFSPDLRG